MAHLPEILLNRNQGTGTPGYKIVPHLWGVMAMVASLARKTTLVTPTSATLRLPAR